MAPRRQPMSADDPRPRDVATWKALRQRTDARHSARRAQARFRRDPATYLATLLATLLAT